MRLLFLTPQLPFPPRQGAALRNWGLMRELARRHEVHLLTFGEPGTPVPDLASVTLVPSPPARSKKERLRDLLGRAEPDMARRLASGPMAAALAVQLARYDFDAVQVEGIEMVPFALPHLDRRDGPRWVYDAHNAETDLQRSALLADARKLRRWHAAAYSAVQTLKLRRFERTVLPKFDLVVVVSDADAWLLAARGSVEPLVIPNGVDTAGVAPSIAPAPEMRARPGPALVFSGKMDFRPNVDGLLWFVDDILPLVEGSPTLWVVGQAPHRALARLRAHPQVVLTGWVERVEPYIAAADAVVVPLRMGSGTRLKVLQALSLACPLVGTTLGCAGLRLQDGTHARLADTPRAFAAALTDLLHDCPAAAAMGQRGRAHVQEHFDWHVLVPRLERELSELVGAHRSL